MQQSDNKQKDLIPHLPPIIELWNKIDILDDDNKNDIMKEASSPPIDMVIIDNQQQPSIDHIEISTIPTLLSIDNDNNVNIDSNNSLDLMKDATINNTDMIDEELALYSCLPDDTYVDKSSKATNIIDSNNSIYQKQKKNKNGEI